MASDGDLFDHEERARTMPSTRFPLPISGIIVLLALLAIALVGIALLL